jgi:two-component system CheB/CheR fusion protein
MARQTLRTSATGEEFVERFEGRLAALANAHKLLFDSDWHGAELRALVGTQLQAHSMGDTGRIRVEGPGVMLPPELATPFGLVLHELATNATKYGALSKDGGTVSISWSTTPGNDGPRLKFEWREQDGPRKGPQALGLRNHPDRERPARGDPHARLLAAGFGVQDRGALARTER